MTGLPRSLTRDSGTRATYAGAMTPALVAVLVVACCLVGLCGIVVPVLPGSILVGLSALAWAVWGGSSWGWVAFGIAAVLVCIGMGSSMLLTRRDLVRRDIPRGPVLFATACALVGTFVIPVVGIFVGFALGLFVAELVRVRDLREAATSSLVALRSFGTGILVEFGCALAATGAVATSMLTRFVG